MTTGVYLHDYGMRHPGLDRDAAKAKRPQPRQLKARRLEAGGKTYAAYDAHALLEATDPSHLARPGHPLG